jgi:hypothetical protein
MRFIGLFVVCISPLLHVFAQTVNPIISTNYAVAQIDAQIAKNAYRETINLTWTPEDAVSDPIGEFSQYAVRYMAVADGYGIKQIKVQAYESTTQMDFYCQGDSPIFAILYSTSEGCANRYKVYYERHQVIKCLKQTSNCSGNELGSFIELKNEENIAGELNAFEMIEVRTDEKIYSYLNSLEEDATVYPLRKEIKDISTYADLMAFVARHSPSFADLDTLYTLLTDKPCPPGLTNSVVNGDPSAMQNLPKDYLHFVMRNSVQQLNYTLQSEKDLEQIPTFLDFKTTLSDYASKVNIPLAQNFERSYSNFSLEPLSTNNSKEMLNVPCNIKNWGMQLARNRVLYYPSVFAYKSDLVMYQMNEFFDDSAEYDEEAENAKQEIEDAFENKFCTDTYSKNLYRYLSAQVFGDIVFIYINNRWVFFDIDR